MRPCIDNTFFYRGFHISTTRKSHRRNTSYGSDSGARFESPFVLSILTISVADLPEIHKRELPCRAASILNYYNLDTLQFSTGWQFPCNIFHPTSIFVTFNPSFCLMFFCPHFYLTFDIHSIPSRYPSVGVQLVKDIEFRGRHDRCLVKKTIINSKRDLLKPLQMTFGKHPFLFQLGQRFACEQGSFAIGFQVCINRQLMYL